MANIYPSTLANVLGELVAAGNDKPLSLKMRFCAGGEPVTAGVQAGVEPVFELPVEIEPPLSDDTPATWRPSLKVEEVKSNILGWLNLALKETARLNVSGRMEMADKVISEIQNTMNTVRRFVC